MIINILIAEDNIKNRAKMRSILQKRTDFNIIGEANNGKEAIQLVEELLPDIILMDIVMPVINGLDAAKEISSKYPKVKVILLSYYCNREYEHAASISGAKGCILKESSSNELQNAIDTVIHGREYFRHNSSYSF
jgi:DNA-binding NarL/FixJ family response regulator